MPAGNGSALKPIDDLGLGTDHGRGGRGSRERFDHHVDGGLSGLVTDEQVMARIWLQGDHAARPDPLDAVTDGHVGRPERERTRPV